MSAPVEHVDVLVVGAGLSGIGAACHLVDRMPGTSYLLLEARDTIGGTWDLFRYPGIRSDSDMFTLGYRFRPWTEEKAIADGPAILRYVQETAREYGVAEHVRHGRRVTRAGWDSATATWTVEVDGPDGAERYTCGFLWMCSGYYDYAGGYLPEFPGVEDYAGELVHPQAWPEDLDHAGRRVVVVGSGATAVTLVPAMAGGDGAAEHVTMLQRSPTYVVSLPAVDKVAQALRARLPHGAAYALTRWKNVAIATGFYQLARRRPELVRGLIRKGTVQALGEDYDVDTHFRPAYDPWDQRLCFVPDGDLFRVLRQGRAEVVTDRIATFTEKGIRLESGRELEADVVVAATGLNLLAFGGVDLVVDGEPVSLPDTMAYKGMMLSGVPNFAYVVGYTNASWTLKADLVSEYVIRLLRLMARRGAASVVPERDPSVAEEPFLDFASGYVQRSVHRFPKQGARAPWRLRMNYLRDVVTIRHGRVDDGALRFSPPPA